jgi:hypothetical protein
VKHPQTNPTQHATSASSTGSVYLNVKCGSGIGGCGWEGPTSRQLKAGAGLLSGVPPVTIDIDQGTIIRASKSMPRVAIRMILSMLDRESF